MAAITDEIRELLAEGIKLDAQRKELKREIKTLEDSVTELNKRIDEISFTVHGQLLSDAFTDDELSITVGELGRVELSMDSYFSVLAGNKPELIARLKSDDNARHLVKEDVNHRSLEAYCREVFREVGKYPHDDIVNVYHKPTLKFKKS